MKMPVPLKINRIAVILRYCLESLSTLVFRCERFSSVSA